MVVKSHSGLNETIIIKTLSSGAKCYIIPKCGYREKEAALAVRYGSADTAFQIQGENRKNAPQGTAHFIEHKLFEEEWGDAFAQFAKNGANANAFTDAGKTAYYFSCTQTFPENLRRLLNFVQSPYFVEESVEKEKEIIGSEITMYDDDPYWQVYFNMLQCMYHHHPVAKIIAGSKEDIADVTADTLYESYDAFYSPDNMVLVCAGDVDPEEILHMAEEAIKPCGRRRAKTILEKEPLEVGQNYCQANMDVTKPLFHLGFKLPVQPKDDLKRAYGAKLLLDLMFGSSSALYEELYNTGLVDEELGLQYTWGDGYAFAVVSGSSHHPKETAQKLYSCLEAAARKGFTLADFNRIKKKHLGRFLRGFNSVDAIVMSQLDLGAKDTDLLEAFQGIKSMTKEYLEDFLKRDWKVKHSVLSVVQGK